VLINLVLLFVILLTRTVVAQM